jgi:hypothetical protein
MTKTYTIRSNANRAARQACAAAGVQHPLAGVHYKVDVVEGGFTVTLINVKTGETTSEAGEALPDLIDQHAEERKANAADVLEKVAKPSLVALAATVESGSADDRLAVQRAYENANATRKADLERARKEAAERKAAKAKPKAEKAPTDPKAPPRGPQFSERTQKRYVDKLAEVQAFVDARDAAGLRAVVIPPHTVKQSWHSINNYRNRAIAWIEANA